MKYFTNFLYSMTAGVLFLTPPFTLAQGSLTPPGPPGPTMKTLAQIEPRAPIGSLPFIITNSGAYYLTGNLTGPAALTGITVQADNVTLDLGGFTLSGTSGTQTGVLVSGSRKNFVLRNGAVVGWNTGVNAASANNCSFETLRLSDNRAEGVNAGANATLRNCSAFANGGDGIVAGRGAILKECVAKANSFSGITVGDESQLSECIASSNTDSGFVLANSCIVFGCTASSNGAKGLTSGASSVLENCAALSNTTIGIEAGTGAAIKGATVRLNGADGIRAAAASKLSDCASSNNKGSGIVAEAGCHINGTTISNNGAHGLIAAGDANLVQCSASKNAQSGLTAGDASQILDCKVLGNGIGIQAGTGSLVRNCTSQGNTANGIIVSSECTVVQNHSYNNFNARDAAGILATGADNCIKENSLISNDRGLSAGGAGNLVIRNSAANNTLTYFYAPNLPQLPGPTVTSTNDVNFVHPWANFQY